jgi:nitrogen-specific signal transduction histidine kinase
MSKDEKADGESISIVKHDIKNQLSNITLALEQLKYEIPHQNADCQYYFETISDSCKSINSLLNNL